MISTSLYVHKDHSTAMKSIAYIIPALLIFLFHPASGQEKPSDLQYSVADTLNENYTLFDREDLLSIALRFDMTKFKRTRSDTVYLKATLTYYINDKDSINKDIKVRARGEFRRNYCDFPPIMLNFRTKDSIKGEFSRINKLKLVTECKPGREELVMKEYLIYKLYNVLTENSFRVRLLRVNYINTFKQTKPEIQFGFVIEPLEMLVNRINCVEIKTTNLTQKNVKPEMMDRFAVFNYMIGNTDWSVPIQHNALILSQPGSERPDLGVIIPYDFDFSGLVGSTYASPFPGLPINSVRDRLYLGICRDEAVFAETLKKFLDKKAELYKVIEEFPYLKEKSKKEMTSYLDEFFNGINDRNTLARKLASECMRF